MTIISFLIFVIAASICAWIAEGFVPKQIPGGYFTAAMTGIMGAWVGANILGNFGPALEGVSLLPTVTGSALFVSILAIFTKLCRKSSA
jgi:uncharacterized membrane protein YeaQ/YmgE (transglycosylase-associated protein family)